MLGVKRTTDEFIKLARLIHDDRYGYDSVVYVNCKQKIVIFCKLCHKDFLIRPDDILHGKGCRTCGIKRRVDNSRDPNQFLLQARLRHGNKFEYPELNTNYVNTKTNISIFHHVCNSTFQARPDNHLSKPNGCCRVCANKKISLCQSYDVQHFLTLTKKNCNDEFEYDVSSYTSFQNLVRIRHKTCGFEFEQRAVSHVSGQGCPRCTGRWSYNHDEFVRRARIIHGDKYEYIDHYTNTTTKIDIKCLSCKLIWNVHPMMHFRGGCPRCYRKRFVSISETEWLDSLEIPKENRTKWIKIDSNKSFLVDAYHNGIVYEFYGSYYHGDLRTTKLHLICQQANRTFGELYQNTLLRHIRINSAYPINFVWEYDWKKGELFSKQHPHVTLLSNE